MNLADCLTEKLTPYDQALQQRFFVKADFSDALWRFVRLSALMAPSYLSLADIKLIVTCCCMHDCTDPLLTHQAITHCLMQPGALESFHSAQELSWFGSWVGRLGDLAVLQQAIISKMNLLEQRQINLGEPYRRALKLPAIKRASAMPPLPANQPESDATRLGQSLALR